MTAPATIRTAELRRMAKIAKEEDVDCWIERDGCRYGVSPQQPKKSETSDSNRELRL